MYDVHIQYNKKFYGLYCFLHFNTRLFLPLNLKINFITFQFQIFSKTRSFKIRNYNFLLEINEPSHFFSVQVKWWKRTNVFLIKPVLPAKKFQVLMMDLPVIINMLALKCPTSFVKVAKTRWLEFRKIL